MIITLTTVITIGIVVCHPCFGESPFLASALDMRLKCSDSGLDVRELLFEKPVNVTGPIGRERVDVFQGEGNGFYKFVGSRSESVHPMHANQQQAAKEANESRNESGGWDVDQWFWFLAGVLPGIIFLVDALLNSHIT